MPCDTIRRKQAEQEKRNAELNALIERIKGGTARITRLGDTVSVEGWEERGEWCDECAIRALRQSSDFEVRMMVEQTVPAAGVAFGHSH